MPIQDAIKDPRRKDSAPPFPRPATGVRVYLSPDEYEALTTLAEREDRATQAQATRFVREGLIREGAIESAL